MHKDKNIGVTGGVSSGSLVGQANQIWTNELDAQKLNNQLVGEVGGQISDKFNKMGVAVFDVKDVINALGA